jgi:hypothetical protein
MLHFFVNIFGAVLKTILLFGIAIAISINKSKLKGYKMHEGLIIAASGGVKQQIKMDVLANNMANMNSAGFKSDGHKILDCTSGHKFHPLGRKY